MFEGIRLRSVLSGGTVLFLFLCAFVAPGCGGGGGGGTTLLTESEGQITTLGPVDQVLPEGIVVMGVRYGTAVANVWLDGVPGTTDELKPGHIVCVRGRIERDGTTVADQVELNSNVVGAVAAQDAGTNRLTVLDQTVLLVPETEYDPGIAEQIAEGRITGEGVRVSGRVRPDGTIESTRVGRAPIGAVRVLGTVSGLDADRFHFTIHGLPIDFGAAFLIDVPGGFPTDGNEVIVDGNLEGGVLVATRVAGFRPFLDSEFGTEARLDGIITRLTSGSDFAIGNLLVSVSPATEFPNGAPRDLLPGARVHVEGTFLSGVTRADRITFGSVMDPTGTVRFPFTGFDEISVGSAFRVVVEQDAGFEVEVTVDEDVVRFLSVVQEDDLLRIGFEPTGGNIGSETLEVCLRMPSLVRVELTGAAQATLIGFQEERLELDLSGAASVTGRTLGAERLVARLGGASRVFLGDIEGLSDVAVDMGGGSRATVNVQPGGSITGALTLSAALFYYGTDVALDVSTDFGATVTRLGETR